MNTAIVSGSDNIQGNISSCTVKISERPTGRDLWTIQKEYIAVNNCTGEQSVTNSWEVSGLGILIVVVVSILATIAVTIIGSVVASMLDGTW